MAAVRSFIFNILFYGFTIILVFCVVPPAMLLGAKGVGWAFRRWCNTTMWLIGRVVSMLGHIKVTVEGARQNQLPEVLEGARRVHDEGRPILIYPEGTLMRPGKKMRYRAGAWHIYNELGVPAVPVAKSLSLAWPRRDWRKFPARCAMEFLEPIPPGLGKQEFMQLVEDRIELGSNALIRELAEPEVLETLTFDYEHDGGSWSAVRKPEAPSK